MKPTTIPVSCSIVLTATFAAGLSHWWSVRQFTDIMQNGVPVAPLPAATPDMPQSAPPMLASNQAAKAQLAEVGSASSQSQREFFEALIDKMARVEAQNRDLIDQLAETNRDLMQLGFRVDTHSESFRPLPLVEDKPFSSIDQNVGVLPPRAEPVSLPSYE